MTHDQPAGRDDLDGCITRTLSPPPVPSGKRAAEQRAVARPTPAASARVPDERLLQGLGLGNRQTSVAFVRRFERRVFGLAYSIVGDSASAEDVAQEAMVRAWRHAAAFDRRRGSVATWLLNITRNLSIDSLRRRRALPVEPGTLLAYQAPAPGPGPDESVATADDAERVRAAVAELPPGQRRAVVLASFQGWTALEISNQEGIPLGTAKTRIRSGLLKLRDTLGCDIDDPIY